MRLAGRFDEAIALIKKAIRHNPYCPASYLELLASSYRDSGRYEEALVTYQKLFDRAKNGEYPLLSIHLSLTIIYMLLERENEAKEHAAEALRISPNYSIELSRNWYSNFKDPAYFKFVLDALRKAGIPESASS